MVYEIYQLTDGEKELNIFVVWQTITDSVKILDNRENVQNWIDENGLIGFNLDNPTQKMDYRDYNKLVLIINS